MTIRPATGWLVQDVERRSRQLPGAELLSVVVRMGHPGVPFALLIACDDEGEAVSWSCVRRLGHALRPHGQGPDALPPSLRRNPKASTAPCRRVETRMGYVLRAPA